MHGIHYSSIICFFLQLEEPLLDKTKQKMTQLVNTHSLQSTSQSNTSAATDTMTRLAAARFIDEAITVLIKARRMLQFCYVYGYYLQGNNIKRMVFELLQVCDVHILVLLYIVTTGICGAYTSVVIHSYYRYVRCIY